MRRRLRRSAHHPHVLASAGPCESKEGARALGCAAFVAKPCSLVQLVDVVAQVRSGSRGLEITTYAKLRISEYE